MFDIELTTPNRLQYLFSLALFAFIISHHWHYVLSNKLRIPHSNQYKAHLCWLIIGIIIYCLADFTNGDYFHYYEEVKRVGHSYYNNLEDIYVFIILNTNNNYIVFRCTVWLTALLLFYQTIRRVKLDPLLMLYIFAACFIFFFAYARVSLAMAIYYFGLSFILWPIKNQNLLSKILGALLIVTCFFFHRSSLILIAATFFIFVPINKKVLLLAVISIPIIAHIMQEYLIALFGSDMINNQDLLNKFNNYSQRDIESGIARMVLNPLKYACYYIPYIIITYKLYFSGENTPNLSVLRLYKITFSIICFASICFLFDFDNKILAYRTLYMTFIPMNILIGYSYKSHIISRKTFMSILSLGIVAHFSRLFYAIYCITQ